MKIVALVMGRDGNANVVNIMPAWVCDVSQTDERTQCAAERSAGQDLRRPAWYRPQPQARFRAACVIVDNAGGVPFLGGSAPRCVRF